MIATTILRLQIAHDLGEHERPTWRCPDCGSRLHAERLAAVAEQGALIGYCHDGGIEHAWYHRHGSVWVRPAEARPFA